MNDILNQLTQVLEQRKTEGDPNTSYVAQLHSRGLNKILEKVGEECTEILLAAKDAEKTGNTQHLIAETADLWFHCMVMLSHMGEDVEAVLQELGQRFGLSGIEEKVSRQPKG